MALVSGVGGGKSIPTKTATSTKVVTDPSAARYAAMEAAAKKAANIRGITTSQLLSQMQKGPLKPYVAPTKTAPKAAAPAKPPATPAAPEQLPVFQDVASQEQPFTWTLEGDPTYQASLAAGESQFNYARANALADLQNQQTQTAAEEKALNKSSAESRRRLAGNYASRGMAGGAAGALTLAEAEANARQIAAQTSLKDQIATLNQQYLANYGATGTDWTGTLAGQQYKTAAAQTAITNQLAQRGVA